MESYFSMQQLAKYLKMKETALEQLVKDGTVPFVKTQKDTVIFRKSDIDKWMEDKRKKVKEMLEGREVL